MELTVNLNGVESRLFPPNLVREIEAQMARRLSMLDVGIVSETGESSFDNKLKLRFCPEERWGVVCEVVGAPTFFGKKYMLWKRDLEMLVRRGTERLYRLNFDGRELPDVEIVFKEKVPLDEHLERLAQHFKRRYLKDTPLAADLSASKFLEQVVCFGKEDRVALVISAGLIAQGRGAAGISQEDLDLAISRLRNVRLGRSDETTSYLEKLSQQFQPVEPMFSFKRLVVSEKAMREIELALVTIDSYSFATYKKWGLLGIDRFPRSVLNFYGPPGTGKTVTAHAIADRFRKKIIMANCHSLQSKWHGESSKNVKAAFMAAKRHNAILFFDEADSLISQRLSEVRSGSEDEINNMRNTILMCLEEHEGIVIFASNFVKRYDYAFETRIQNVYFPLPDEHMLERIWDAHLPVSIPGARELDRGVLATRSCALSFCGRDVKNAVLRACKIAIANGANKLLMEDILSSCQYIADSKIELRQKQETKRNDASSAYVESAESSSAKLKDVLQRSIQLQRQTK